MKAMGWSYQDYQATPVRVIQEVETVLGAQNKARQDATRRGA